MARDLVSLGHRRIGVISGPPSLTTTHDRMAGFRSGLTESGATLPKRLVRVGDFTSDSGEREMSRLLDDAPDVTAVFASKRRDGDRCTTRHPSTGLARP